MIFSWDFLGEFTLRFEVERIFKIINFRVKKHWLRMIIIVRNSMIFWHFCTILFGFYKNLAENTMKKLKYLSLYTL